MAELTNNDPDRWRGKYYDQLEALEKKEREWHALEEILRQGLLRLATAAESGDAALDRQLTELRAALRREADSNEIAERLDRVTEGVARLERSRKQGGASPAHQLLRRLIEQTLEPHHPNEAKLLLGRIAPADTEELGRIGDDLATALRAGDEEALPLHVALVQLVEFLAFPTEFNDEVDALKTLLSAPLKGGRVEEALLRIAGLVSEARRRVLNEKRELEGFLRQLTENLQELDLNLHAAVTEHLESINEGRKLGASMDAQMEGIEASVQAAGELAALKSTIQQRVTTIRSHMEAFRKAEEQRTERAELNAAALTSRLRELENEAATLRDRVRVERMQAHLDPLTGVFNRLAYDERLEQEYQRWKRYRGPLSLTVWDVDRFKRINDKYGHQAGDKVLKVIAKVLGSQLRATDFLCRYGGEEFVILLPETNLARALTVAEKLRAGIEAAEFRYRGELVKITASCGAAEFTGEETPDDVFARADKALYAAKESGRNCCRGA
jgi:diguanylate cyclase